MTITSTFPTNLPMASDYDIASANHCPTHKASSCLHYCFQPTQWWSGCHATGWENVVADYKIRHHKLSIGLGSNKLSDRSEWMTNICKIWSYSFGMIYCCTQILITLYLHIVLYSYHPSKLHQLPLLLNKFKQLHWYEESCLLWPLVHLAYTNWQWHPGFQARVIFRPSWRHQEFKLEPSVWRTCSTNNLQGHPLRKKLLYNSVAF